MSSNINDIIAYKGLATDYLINASNKPKPSRLVSVKMDEKTLSGTAEFSEEENDVLLPPSVKEAEAKFSFTPRQVGGKLGTWKVRRQEAEFESMAL